MSRIHRLHPASSLRFCLLFAKLIVRSVIIIKINTCYYWSMLVIILCIRAPNQRLVHVSGIGADPESSSPYIRARGRGELAVTQAFDAVTLVRPAVMFGPDDAFLTRIVKLIRTLPVYPM